MKILIITAAGLSSRFSRSVGFECLKCIYSSGDDTGALLYQMIHQPVEFDHYIIVGGYMYEELVNYVKKMFTEYGDKIILVKNEKYRDYGSGYSLYVGLYKAMEYKPDEIVFAEGDLFVDPDGFKSVYQNKLSVVTSNTEAILADKSVAFYYDINDKIHYIYDTGHNALQIKEPFRGIFNSGQIWKFAKPTLICDIFDMMREEEWQGTNLVFIQNYFQRLARDEYANIRFSEWINCNTVEDWRLMFNLGKGINNEIT